MISLFKRLTRGFWREDGTATIEFVMAVPILMAVFTASFESGLLMTRTIMLDQAVDITMRELRLGHLTAPNAAVLKKEICKRTVILDDCEANTIVELTRISTTTWKLPTARTNCINRDLEFQPPDIFVSTNPNDMMLVRVCVRQDLMFPTTGLGLKLASDGKGGYGLITVTAFVVEPE